jgi:homogentisate 1,2-dioxygenase
MTRSAESHSTLYSRNGFAGPMAVVSRAGYPPSYTRITGSYEPVVMNLHELDSGVFANPRALPVPVLRDTCVSLEVAYRSAAMPFAYRNVRSDEVHVIMGGSATLVTDFGQFHVRKDDIILIPRAISYRYVDLSEQIREFILCSDEALNFVLSPGLGPLVELDYPTPSANTVPNADEYEILLRHGDQFTSVFTDSDPLACGPVSGTQVVAKMNIADLPAINIERGVLAPPAIITGCVTETMIYDLSSRTGDRPPVHFNADYDECVLYMAGPGNWGAVSTSGTLTHTPKGFPHQGPEENVPGGYRAILIETRANLTSTPAGHEIAKRADTAEYGIHPSIAEAIDST